MSDTYYGTIKCPYCQSNTEFSYHHDWGVYNSCLHCKRQYDMELKLTPVRLEDKENEK